MEKNEFKGISRKRQPKPDYSYLIKNSSDYGSWEIEDTKRRKKICTGKK